MAPFRSLQARIWQDWATNVQATTPTGGTWPALTIHLLVRARYLTKEGDSGASDQDATGIGVFGVTDDSVVNNIVVAASDKVVITYDAARTTPAKYEFYFQNAATVGAQWDYTATAQKLGEVDGHLLTAEFTDDFNTGTLAANHNSLTTITLDPAWFTVQKRELLAPGYNGIGGLQSVAFTPVQLPSLALSEISPFSMLQLDLKRISCSKANRRTLHKWFRNRWPLILIDVNTSSWCEYDYYYGRFDWLTTHDSNLHELDVENWSLTMALEGVHAA